jgi:hypothetical protein
VKVFHRLDGVDDNRPNNKNPFLRDQNFGINDLAAVQDVRNDFTQQDIDESTVIKDKGMERVLSITYKTLTLIRV